MDPLPGYKTQITAVATMAFTILSLTGVIDLDQNTREIITGGLVAAMGLFLAMKINRVAPPPGKPGE